MFAYQRAMIPPSPALGSLSVAYPSFASSSPRLNTVYLITSEGVVWSFRELPMSMIRADCSRFASKSVYL